MVSRTTYIKFNVSIILMSLAEELNIQKYEITSSDKIEKDVFLLKYTNGELFSKGNISSVIGKAKSRKTYLCTLFSGAIINGNLYGKFRSDKYRVLYIDTEQSPWYVQKVLQRIIKIGGTESMIGIFHLRPLNPRDRVSMIDAILKAYSFYDFVVIDGARDLLYDINSQEQSTEVVTKLLYWSETYNMHIQTVIHENKNDNYARGHIGTEIMNKSETVIRVEKQQHLSIVHCDYSRNLPFDDFAFSIEDDIPILDNESYDEFKNGKEAKRAPF